MNLAVSVSPDVASIKRLPFFDALKGYAILLVIYYHVAGTVGWITWIHAEAGVDIFLLVSGFLLARGAADLPAGEFWARRFFRIYPKYWIALALFLALHWRYFDHVYDWPDLLWHATGLHAVAHPSFFSSINDSFWFVSLILILYAAFWLLRKYLDEPLAMAGWGMLLSAVACGYFTLRENQGGIIHFAPRIPAFFLGLIAGRCWSAPRLVLRPTWPMWAGAAGLLAAYLFTGFIAYYPVIALGWMAPLFVGYQVFGRFAVGRVVFVVLGFIGRYSYELYLLHQPLIHDFSPFLLRYFRQLEPEQVSPWLKLSGGLAFTVGGVAAIALGERLWAGLRAPIRHALSITAAVLVVAAVLWPLERYFWRQGVLHFEAMRTAFRANKHDGADTASHPGPVRLRVNLPRTVSALGYPLVVTGRAGAGDIVALRCVEPGRYAISFDHWGAPVRISPVVALRTDQPHDIIVSMGSLLRSDGDMQSSPLKRILFVSVDGVVALNLRHDFYPSTSIDCAFGRNPIGGTTTAATFPGGVVAREGVPPEEILRSVAANMPLRWVYIEK